MKKLHNNLIEYLKIDSYESKTFIMYVAFFSKWKISYCE